VWGHIGTCRTRIEWSISVRLEGKYVISAWILLMLNSLFVTLRLSGGGGSFPRPLKAEEERHYLERLQAGDMEARNILIEHNLRLVAHIMKNV
jgi:RNA polymerase sporulation-specific sigma factor